MLLDCVGRTKEDIGKDVEDWRRRTKITQTELAHMIGLSSDKAYRRICIDCTAEFSQKSLRLLAKLMNVSVEFLIPDAQWDYVVLTASNEAQAMSFEEQIAYQGHGKGHRGADRGQGKHHQCLCCKERTQPRPHRQPHEQ